MRKNLILVLLTMAMLHSASFGWTAKKLFFTSNTLSSGTSVKPGFSFEYTFNAIGTARNGHQFVGFGNTDEGLSAGDVCIVEYDPYTNTMSSPGTITEAYQRAGNLIAGEYCNKVHTWLTATPDDKIWMGSQSGGRGGHLLYVDTKTGVLTDYSRTQKYIYLSDPKVPAINHPEFAPSKTNGIAIQDCDFVSMNMNPYCPRYLWTHSYTNFYYHCWDMEADTTYAYAGGNGNMRVLLVDKKGCLWYSQDGFATKRVPGGSSKLVGRGLETTNAPGGSAFVYTHSYDSAYTVARTSGEIELYDFTHDTVVSFANLPDGTSGHQHYRAITVSRDGKSLYVIGDGNLYQVNIITRQYTNIGSIASYLPGDYAFGSGNMDTLGNWYICCRGNSEKYLLQINLGKDAVRQLYIPPASEKIEGLRLASANSMALNVRPEPFTTQARISFPAAKAEGGLILRIFNAQGRLVKDFGSFSAGSFSNPIIWNAADVPSGNYIAAVKSKTGLWSRKITRQ